jgi:hypothetical protein
VRQSLTSVLYFKSGMNRWLRRAQGLFRAHALQCCLVALVSNRFFDSYRKTIFDLFYTETRLRSNMQGTSDHVLIFSVLKVGAVFLERFRIPAAISRVNMLCATPETISWPRETLCPYPASG